MPTAEQIEKMMAAKRALMPKEGYNLVGVDDYEEPGEDLYLIGNYASAEDAEAAKLAKENDGCSDKMFIYGPEN